MGYKTYRRYECELCEWHGMITGGLRRIWQGKLPEAHEELKKHFEEEHGITSWSDFRVKVVTGYLKDLDISGRNVKVQRSNNSTKEGET